MKIIKRSGMEDTFDIKKIEAAIRKANESVIDYEKLTEEKIQEIHANVEKAFAVLAKKAGIYGMVGGQVLDVERAGLPMDEDQLAFIYENKTGALIAAACMCGAYLAGADDAVVAQLDEAAYAVGFAFQLQDDI